MENKQGSVAPYTISYVFLSTSNNGHDTVEYSHCPGSSGRNVIDYTVCYQFTIDVLRYFPLRLPCPLRLCHLNCRFAIKVTCDRNKTANKEVQYSCATNLFLNLCEILPRVSKLNILAPLQDIHCPAQMSLIINLLSFVFALVKDHFCQLNDSSDNIHGIYHFSSDTSPA